MKKITCIPEKGIDGYWRIFIDVYYCFARQNEIKKALKKETGIDWKHFGTFMDLACYATKKKPPKKFTAHIPWDG